MPRKKKTAKEKLGKVPASLSQYIASMQEYKEITWLKSGIPTIDLLIGNGIPRGRFTEILGDPSGSKSVVGLYAIASVQNVGGHCILIDSEHKTDKSFAEKFGVDFTKLGYPVVSDIYDTVRVIGRIAEMSDGKDPILIVWDSLASTEGVDEFEKVKSNDGLGSEPASRARQLSSGLRAVLGEVAKKDICLVGINQLRTFINFRGITKQDSPGGKAVKFYAAVRLKLTPLGAIRSQRGGGDVKTGITVVADVVKNTCAIPFRSAQLKFSFDDGFAPYSGLVEMFLRYGRLYQTGGWLVYKNAKFREHDLPKIIEEHPELMAPFTKTVENNIPNTALAEPINNGNGELVAIEEEEQV